jgi:thioredoxin-related protein
MKKLKLLVLLTMISGGIFAQGINFEQNLSWLQIKEKSKAENKFIFMDCNATWCGPCRFMADSVFTQQKVGDFMNEKFISVKVQLDTTKNDNAYTRQWYKDAAEISKANKVTNLPAYLFFAPDGKVVHKDVGAKGGKSFIAIANTAVDPSKQYYTLIERFHSGDLMPEEMPVLVKATKDLGDKDTSLEIAKKYMHVYLDKLSEQDLLTKSNLEFIDENMEVLHSNDRVFSVYEKQFEKVDAILEYKGYSKSRIDYIITKEEITPSIKIAKSNNSTPDWKSITKVIKKKYKSIYVGRNIAAAKVSWYRQKKDWKNYTKYLVEQMEYAGVNDLQSGTSSLMMLNGNAWQIFKYSNNKKELEKALLWMKLALPMDPRCTACMDTKANLLYKLGRKQEAIVLEEKAYEVEGPEGKLFKETAEKMKRNEQTWLNKEELNKTKQYL